MTPGMSAGFLLLVLLATFAVGGATGALVLSAWNPPPRPTRHTPPVGRHRRTTR
ncbi:MAG TPA: hypothetical protein VFX70_04705 [Mycobacteriales bacterium]|nr:hypothetical protein [Mycobacteriales bacterium]